MNIEKIITTLKFEYPDAKCSLNFETPLQLLIATILSAQSTDNQINKITPTLFERFYTVEDFAFADIEELETLIKSSGFYRAKAKSIKKCCKKILSDFGGTVPSSMEELTSLSGVGRKTANVVLLNAFGICNGIAIDTHAKRVSNRIGLSKNDDPSKIEQDLLGTIPRKYWEDMNHLFVYHGRNVCTARNPQCHICKISTLCEYAAKQRGDTIS